MMSSGKYTAFCFCFVVRGIHVLYYNDTSMSRGRFHPAPCNGAGLLAPFDNTYLHFNARHFLHIFYLPSSRLCGPLKKKEEGPFLFFLKRRSKLLAAAIPTLKNR